ncbi:flagellar hook-length control protein FliK [Glaciecola sp. 1036]|uniref:flagellar hook-length control protein FliK n=1 Tax=Alteromonadaceae TaxID=72275 RepID=UPI003CFDA2F2
MMQQIATQTKDIAAPILPVDVKVEPKDGTEFSLVLQEQTSPKVSAFEGARTRAEKIKGDEPTGNKHQQNSEPQANTPEPLSDDVNAKSPQKPENVEQVDQVVDTKISGAEKPKTENSDSNLDNENDHDDEYIVAIDNYEKYSQILQESGADFNYVEFVTSVKAINQDTLASEQKGIDGGLLDTEQVDVETLSEEEADFAIVHLSQEDLQAILEAQQNTNTEGEVVNEELRQAIENLMSQMKEAQENDSLNSAETQAQESFDQALMEQLLQQPVETNTEVADIIQQFSAQESTTIDLENLPKEILASISKALNELLDAKETTIEAIDKTDLQTLKETIKAVDSQLNQMLAETAEEQSLAQADTGPILQENKSIEIKVNTSSEDANKPLKQLIALDEQRLEKALDNLQQRVQQLVVSMPESKGNEFVAALQSGVKEFKNQLAQGREPGIDLKALVSEALASTETQISDKALPKLDQSISQFSATLNLASSVQQNPQLHASQLFTQAETVAMEKIAQTSLEGTKLAQASSSATSIDKAVNIFKPEGQQQLVEKVRWMINGRNTAAEIRMDPPELGAMQIRINMNGDAATVNFAVQSIQAKESLEQAVPRLREMLQEQGIQLGQSSVQQDSKGSGQDQQGFADNQGMGQVSDTGFSDQHEEFHGSVIEQRISGGSLGGIDYYA